MMSRLRANSNHAPCVCQLVGKPALSEILLSNAFTKTDAHTNATNGELSSSGKSGRDDHTPHHLTRHISHRTPVPIFRRRTLRRTDQAVILRSAGEPQGHTLQRVCRSSSPKFLKRPGQSGFRSLPRLDATQRTLTRRNNATLTQRWSGPGLGQGITRLKHRTRTTQRIRHGSSSLRLNDIHTIPRAARVFRERSKNSRHIRATRRRDRGLAMIFTAKLP